MTKFLHSRAMLVLASLIALACALVSVALAGYQPPLETRGLVSTWSGAWSLPQPLSMWLALAVNVGIAVLLTYINKASNLLRCLTMLQGTTFLLMQMSVPQMLTEVNGGLVLCVAWLVCAMLFFHNFAALIPQNEVFLAFAIMSALSALIGEALIFIPGLWLACGQMRILNVRTVLASLMGLACPWVIYFGFGLVSVDDIEMPTLFSVGHGMSDLSPIYIATLSFTIFVGVACWVQNLVKYVTYTAKYRAYQGFVTASMLLAMVGILCDVADSGALLPILNVCAALQIAHLFGTIHATQKSYIAILIILAIYLLLSYPISLAWQTAAYIL